MMLDKQTQRIKRQDDHQYRDQQIKRVFDHRRHLIRQANTNIMCFKKAHHLNAVNGNQNRGKNPRSAQAIYRQVTVRFWRRHQQKGHNRQHGAHEGIELIAFFVMLSEVIGDRGADVDRHDAHCHIERRQNTPFKLFARSSQARANPQVVSGENGG